MAKPRHCEASVRSAYERLLTYTYALNTLLPYTAYCRRVTSTSDVGRADGTSLPNRSERCHLTIFSIDTTDPNHACGSVQLASLFVSMCFLRPVTPSKTQYCCWHATAAVNVKVQGLHHLKGMMRTPSTPNAPMSPNKLLTSKIYAGCMIRKVS